MNDLDTFLKQNRNADLLRISTAGSVDDGKSTLIGRLFYDAKAIYDDQLEALENTPGGTGGNSFELAYFTDGLKAEREQGITIDVAYRYFSTPKRRFIIADTPGHEQYTRNMVTGASTANLAIILIDASQGVLTQSKRHAFIASLLRVPHVVVAINKMDLVNYDQAVFERIRAEYEAFVTRLDAPDLTFIPISALKGDNVVNPSAEMPWYHGVPLLQFLETVHIGADRNLIDFRMPIQSVLRPSPDFRGYAGQIASGIVRPGDRVTALPSGMQSTVTRVIQHGQNYQEAFATQSVTLCLADEIDLSRGDMLVHPANLPRCARQAEAMLVWMDQEPMKSGKVYWIKQTTRKARAHVTKLHYRIDPNDLHRHPADQLTLNEIGRVNLELYQPLMLDSYANNRATGAFILIDPHTNATAGAGMVIERHRDERTSAQQPSPKSENITRHNSAVTPDQRAQIFRQTPATLWLTGLSGSGKSSIAYKLEAMLTRNGHACFVLDGDNIRHGLNRDLGFSPDDRTENIRRIAEVARLFNDAGLIVITAFISPYCADRNGARAIIGDGRFIETLINTPLAVCESRDPKQLYRKARSGEISNFTGLSAPYEEPTHPELTLTTEGQSPEDCAAAAYAYLHDNGYFDVR